MKLSKFWGRIVMAAIVLVVAAALVNMGSQYLSLQAFSRQAFEVAETYSVRIVRDEFGVPQIYGVTDPDTAFGLGYAQAEDDWATMQTTLVAARGRLARYAGQDAAPTDYIVQLLRIRELVEARYERDLSPATRALVEAYADGLNLYAAEHPRQIWSAELPVRGQDIIAGFVLRTPFMYGLDGDLAELFLDERQRTISMGSSETAFQLIDGERLPFGSNAFAIAPGRSADGATRLLINSHQPFEGPVAWYEARLHSEDGWDMAGATFPGAPLILHGFNPDLGWAHTVNKPDLSDIYVLETEGDRYRLDGEWLDLEHGTARLTVGIFGPVRWTVTRDMWWSRHGPVVRTDHGDYAIRYSGMDQIGQVEQWYAMNRATDFDSWMAAMEINAISSLNAVYADREGHIAYVYNARMPVRGEGYDWLQYLPGDRSELIWDEYLPLTAMPIYTDPDSGWLLSANQTPFDATEPADNIDASGYSSTFGIQPRYSNRAWRGLDLLRAQGSISRERLLEIKFDKVYSGQSPVARLVNELLAEDFTGDAAMTEAQSVLRRWDLATDTANREAALGVLVAVRCIGNLHTNDPWLMDPVEALRDSAAELMAHHGRLDPQWGEVNRLVRGELNIPIGGGPDVLRAIYAGAHDLDANGQLTAAAGDTSIMLVEWLADGSLDASAIIQYGAATLNESSPHFADQAPLFAAEQWRTLDLSMREGGYRPGDPH
ncbi:penicillin acylase family protein [uncultured Maricaulis sp.]|uniref:penicillin acylase family protein n=1 Tax=uncultured Maricaulis sp. TaxID=174710 RepID=UPI0030D9456B|tara:strand:+ start:33096 stop:35243 length:2148 start_codon:yes stop_codon:yes gene_type:complete